MTIAHLQEAIDLIQSGTFPKFAFEFENDNVQALKLPQGYEIRLFNASISSEGIAAIATALQSRNAPQGLIINLELNDIEVEGAQALATVIQSGNAPQGFTIDLAFNKIGDEGAQALATAIQSENAPENLEINLNGNNIGLEGTKAIANAIQSGRAPQGLQVRLGAEVFFFTEQIKAIATAISSGKAPQGLEVELSDDNLTNEGIRAIADAIQSGQAPQGLKIKLNYGANRRIKSVRALAAAAAVAEFVHHNQITIIVNNSTTLSTSLKNEFAPFFEEARAQFFPNQKQQIITAIQNTQAQLGNDEALTQTLAAVNAIDISSESTLEDFTESVQQLHGYAEVLQAKSSQYQNLAKMLITFATLLAAAAVTVGLTVATAGAVPAAIALGAASTATAAGSGYSFFKAHRINSNIKSINKLHDMQQQVEERPTVTA